MKYKMLGRIPTKKLLCPIQKWSTSIKSYEYELAKKKKKKKKTQRKSHSSGTDKKDKNKRVDSDNMSDIEKMDAGFGGKTYTINGKDVDF